MTRTFVAVLALIASPLALSACEVDTGTELDEDGSTDRTIEFKVDEGALDNARDNLDAAGDAISEGASELRDGAVDAGQRVRDGANELGETIDDNVDIGENARDNDG